MKKLLGLVLGLFLTVSTFANGIVTYSDSKTSEIAKTSGVFNFSFDSQFSLDDINKASAYYTSYFLVTSVTTGENISVNINLAIDNQMSRRIVTRFFVTLSVKSIMVDGKEIQIDKFIETYVMK